MRIAIVGSSGYIAHFLIKRFEREAFVQKILKLDRTEDAEVHFDLMEADRFDYNLLEHIDYIVFTAAISSPDQCASDFEGSWAVNVTGTCHFIREAVNRHCKVLFFSSDAVFGDIPGEIYTEKSETKAVTPYGKMKKAVEDEFQDSRYFKAIRLSYVVSAKDRFVSYCLKCMENNETADVYHPFYRNCIAVNDVVDVVVWFACHWEEYVPFVFNVAGRELVSRVRIADELNRYCEKRLRYMISRPDEKFYQNRPETTQMRSLYMQSCHILEDNTFSEKIKRALEESKDES